MYYCSRISQRDSEFDLGKVVVELVDESCVSKLDLWSWSVWRDRVMSIALILYVVSSTIN